MISGKIEKSQGKPKRTLQGIRNPIKEGNI